MPTPRRKTSLVRRTLLKKEVEIFFTAGEDHLFGKVIAIEGDFLVLETKDANEQVRYLINYTTSNVVSIRNVVKTFFH